MSKQHASHPERETQGVIAILEEKEHKSKFSMTLCVRKHSVGFLGSQRRLPGRGKLRPPLQYTDSPFAFQYKKQ